MKKKILYISLILLSIFSSVSVYAQTQVFRGEINTSGTLKQEGDSLYMTLLLDFDKLKLETNRSLILTPILIDKAQEYIHPFPQTLVNGKVRQKEYIRGLDIQKKDVSVQPYAVVVSGKKHQQVEYTQVIAYQPWMENAQLTLEQDLCGCGKYQEELYTDVIVPRVELEPLPPVVVEPPKVVKEYKEEFNVRLEFPVSKWTILPDFRGNRKELSTLESGIQKILDTPNAHVTRVELYGYASPEGRIAFNQMLSENRANALKSYILERFPSLTSDQCEIKYCGEDWEMLKEWVEASNLSDKAEVLSIIQNTADANVRKQKLKMLNGGATYQRLLREVYPQIRRVTFHVYYR